MIYNATIGTLTLRPLQVIPSTTIAVNPPDQTRPTCSSSPACLLLPEQRVHAAAPRPDLEAVATLTADEAAAAKVPLERCYIGGFSQGGYLALTLVGRAGAPRYGGVWAICCGLPEFAAVPVDLSSGDGRPALVQWGTRDPIVATDQAEAVVASLEAGGWKTRAHAYDMAHSQTIEMMVDARAWLASID